MANKISVVVLSFGLLSGCAGTVPKLGVNNGQLMPCPDTPNCVSSQATSKEHNIEPMPFTGTPIEAQGRLLQIVNALQRTQIIQVDDSYIRAEFTSAIFRFVDDVEFYFPPTKTGEIIIHTRSASRIGYSDLGANRKRIEQIRNKFNAK